MFDDIAQGPFPLLVPPGNWHILQVHEIREHFSEDPVAALSLSVAESIIASASSNEGFRDYILGLRGDVAAITLDGLQAWIDSKEEDHVLWRKAIYLMVKLSAASHKLPPSLFLRDLVLGEDPERAGTGGNSDVFRTRYNNQKVAVKRLRYSVLKSEERDFFKTMCREALIWKQLRHPHILPFLGMASVNPLSQPYDCFVSPWIKHGTLREYLNTEEFNPAADRIRLVYEIVNGLNYLHSQKIVHGDIKDSNILICENGRALISDFGVTIMGDATQGRISTAPSGGTLIWMSPERLEASPTAGSHLKPPVDVYAFALLCIMIYTGNRPFPAAGDFQIVTRVLAGERPPRPTECARNGEVLSDELWELIQTCWSQTPEDRPSIEEVHDHICLYSRSAPIDGERQTHHRVVVEDSQNTAWSIPRTIPTFSPEAWPPACVNCSHHAPISTWPDDGSDTRSDVSEPPHSIFSSDDESTDVRSHFNNTPSTTLDSTRDLTSSVSAKGLPTNHRRTSRTSHRSNHLSGASDQAVKQPPYDCDGGEVKPCIPLVEFPIVIQPTKSRASSPGSRRSIFDSDREDGGSHSYLAPPNTVKRRHSFRRTVRRVSRAGIAGIADIADILLPSRSSSRHSHTSEV